MNQNDSDRLRDLKEDEERVRRIRQIVDIACLGVRTGLLTEDGVEELIADTRRKVLRIAPEKGEEFDLIYESRLMRLWEQFRIMK